jgi:SAM-dependent methyltransferase
MTLTREDMGLSPGAVVLDVGCAEGTGTAALARSGCHAIGVELERHLLQELRRGAATRSLAAIRGDATQLPVADASVDGACVIEVLEHITAPAPVLRELRRVLRPNGRLCVAVPTGYTERVYSKLHPRYLSNAEHQQIFDRDRLTEALRAAGFTVDRVETRNLIPALSWFLHALLRSEADPTGRPLEHRWVEVLTAGPVWVARRVPGLRWLLRLIEARFGKSWYFFCDAP